MELALMMLAFAVVLAAVILAFTLRRKAPMEPPAPDPRLDALLAKQGGAIVNVTSISGLRASTLRGAEVGLVRCVALYRNPNKGWSVRIACRDFSVLSRLCGSSRITIGRVR